MSSDTNRARNFHNLTLVPLALLTLGALIAADPARNTALFLWINETGNRIPALLWENITTLGDGLVATVLLVVFFSKRPALLRGGLVAAILVSLLSRALKWGFDAERPAAMLDHSLFEIIGPTLSHSSFPSGHTMAIFTIAGLAALHYARLVPGLLLFTLALIGGFSRTVVGAHWPMDVFVGAFAG